MLSVILLMSMVKFCCAVAGMTTNSSDSAAAIRPPENSMAVRKGTGEARLLQENSHLATAKMVVEGRRQMVGTMVVLGEGRSSSAMCVSERIRILGAWKVRRGKPVFDYPPALVWEK